MPPSAEPKSLAIVAGSGALPRLLVQAARAEGREVLMVGLQGMVDPETLAAAPSVELPLGAAGKLEAILKERGVREVVFAGKVRRPAWREIRPDWRAARFLAKIGLKALGDNSLVAAIAAAFEEEGFRVIGPDDLLAGLLAPAGQLGRHAPDEEAMADIARGAEVVRAIGLADVGQACVVQQGLVLGVEAIEGTDALIERCQALARPGPGGVLVKMKKPQQERRNDLPTVGMETLRLAAACGLRGIALGAGGTLMLEPAAMTALADERGLFLYGIPEESPGAKDA